MVRYKITLKEEERKNLKSITSKGKHRSQKVMNALILLNCDEGDFQTKRSTNEQVTGVLKISMKKIDRVKKRFVEDGLDVALNGHRGKRVYAKKADGDLEAHFREADDDEVELREGRGKRFPLGSWQHVAVVADGTTARLYRNAVEVASAPFDGTLNTSVRALGIGAKPDDSGMKPDKGNAGYWDGKIDDVRVYDRALWVEEIRALAASK